MIWHTQTVKCKNNPPDIILTIKGIFNHPSEANGQDIIQILLIISGDNLTDREIILYSKNPSSLCAVEEYLDPDVILSRYRSNIQKIVDKISKKDLEYITS